MIGRWWHRFARLFVVKTKFEAFMLIYALAVGAVERGMTYLQRYPGTPGWIMFGACTIVVFMAGGKVLDGVERDAQNE